MLAQCLADLKRWYHQYGRDPHEDITPTFNHFFSPDLIRFVSCTYSQSGYFTYKTISSYHK